MVGPDCDVNMLKCKFTIFYGIPLLLLLKMKQTLFRFCPFDTIRFNIKHANQMKMLEYFHWIRFFMDVKAHFNWIFALRAYCMNMCALSAFRLQRMIALATFITFIASIFVVSGNGCVRFQVLCIIYCMLHYFMAVNC